MKSLALFSLIGSLLLATSVVAQTSSVQGTALDANGRAQKNAEVRLQLENGKGRMTVAKTDAKGHFVASGLAAGSYKVTVMVNGVAKSAMTHVKAVSNKTVTLNIDGRRAAAANERVAQNTKPKYAPRWIPASTGSHLDGHWEDDPRNSQPAGSVDQMSVDQFQRSANHAAVGGTGPR